MAHLLCRIYLSRRKKKGASNNESGDENSRDIIPDAEIAVLDSLLTGCIIIQDDGFIKYANPVSIKMFGYSREELIGHNVKMLMPSNYAANHDG